MEILVEFFSEYIVIVVLGICFCVGYIIKNSISFIPSKYIPLILAILGVAINIWVNKGAFTPEVLLGGLVSGLGSTGAHQIYKQLKKGDE